MLVNDTSNSCPWRSFRSFMYIGSAGPSLGGQTDRQTAADRGRTGGTGGQTEPPRADRTKGRQRLSDSEKRTEGGPEEKPDRLTATLQPWPGGQRVESWDGQVDFYRFSSIFGISLIKIERQFLNTSRDPRSHHSCGNGVRTAACNQPTMRQGSG